MACTPYGASVGDAVCAVGTTLACGGQLRQCQPTHRQWSTTGMPSVIRLHNMGAVGGMDNTSCGVEKGRRPTNCGEWKEVPAGCCRQGMKRIPGLTDSVTAEQQECKQRQLGHVSALDPCSHDWAYNHRVGSCGQLWAAVGSCGQPVFILVWALFVARCHDLPKFRQHESNPNFAATFPNFVSMSPTLG